MKITKELLKSLNVCEESYIKFINSGLDGIEIGKNIEVKDLNLFGDIEWLICESHKNGMKLGIESVKLYDENEVRVLNIGKKLLELIIYDNTECKVIDYTLFGIDGKMYYNREEYGWCLNKFDKRGNLIESKYIHYSDGDIITDLYTYDDDNNLTTQLNSYSNLYQTYEYINGKEVKYRDNKGGWVDTTYNENGLKSSIITDDGKNEYIEYNEFSLITKHFYESGKRLFLYTYDGSDLVKIVEYKNDIITRTRDYVIIKGKRVIISEITKDHIITFNYNANGDNISYVEVDKSNGETNTFKEEPYNDENYKTPMYNLRGLKIK